MADLPEARTPAALGGPSPRRTSGVALPGRATGRECRGRHLRAATGSHRTRHRRSLPDCRRAPGLECYSSGVASMAPHLQPRPRPRTAQLRTAWVPSLPVGEEPDTSALTRIHIRTSVSVLDAPAEERGRHLQAWSRGLRLDIPGLGKGAERECSTPGSTASYGSSRVPINAGEVLAAGCPRRPDPTCRGQRRPWTRAHNRR